MTIMSISEKERALLARAGDAEARFLGASVPPIFESAPFLFKSYEAFTQAIREERKHYLYWRGTNPTVEVAERQLAELEKGEACKCFSSGMAAIHAALSFGVKSGDHVLFVGHIYHSTLDLGTYLEKFHVSHTNVLSTAVGDIEAAIQDKTRVIYLESPTSLQFELADLKAIADLARSKGIRTIIDNTWTTPLFQKPLELGIDIVVHAASKYLGGHNDLVAGAVIASHEIMNQIFYEEFLLFGAALAPLESWLLIRGLRTLPLRMEAHQAAGLAVARFLESHPAVARVNHPGLPAHPHYELGRRQMSGYAGLFSFVLKQETFAAVAAFINRLNVFRIGVSWGGFESEVMSPNYGYNERELRAQALSPGLIRLAVGLEPVQLLIHDLDQALSGSLG